MGKFKIGVMADSFRTDFKTGVEKAAKLGAATAQRSLRKRREHCLY